MRRSSIAVALSMVFGLSLGASSAVASSPPDAGPNVVLYFAPQTTLTMNSQLMLGGDGWLTVKIANPNNVDMKGVGLTLTATSGLTYKSINSSPCGGTWSGSSLTLSGGAISKLSTCQFNVSFHASSLGAKTISRSLVANNLVSEMGPPPPVNLTVIAPPTLYINFSSPSVTVGGSVNMVMSLKNNASVAISAEMGTDGLAGGVTTASTSSSGPCGSTIKLIPANHAIGIATLTIPAGGTCTATIALTGATVGTQSWSMLGAGDWGEVVVATSLAVTAPTPAPAKATATAHAAATKTPQAAATVSATATATDGGAESARPSASDTSAATPADSSSPEATEEASASASPSTGADLVAAAGSTPSGSASAAPAAPSSSSSGDSGSPLLLIVGGLALLAAAAGGAGFFFVRKRRGQAA